MAESVVRSKRTLNDSCVCVLAWCKGFKNWLHVVDLTQTHTVSVSCVSVVFFLSMFGCQAQLRELEGSIPPLQSRLLWQHFAVPFVCIHTQTRGQGSWPKTSSGRWTMISRRGRWSEWWMRGWWMIHECGCETDVEKQKTRWMAFCLVLYCFKELTHSYLCP